MTHLPWYVSQPEFVMKLYSNEPTGTFNYFKKKECNAHKFGKYALL